jgi:hypothetical protein
MRCALRRALPAALTHSCGGAGLRDAGVIVASLGLGPPNGGSEVTGSIH